MNYTEKNTENQEKNNDILVKCTTKKLKNPKFTNYIRSWITEKMYYRIKDCGSFLEMLADLEIEHKKLKRGNFCKNRFCPMCSWRISCKDSLKISILMEHLRKEEVKEFIFLTLTAPNVYGDSLNDEINRFNKAFKRLMELKEVKSIAKGYIRKLEVTYQKEKYITKFLWKRKKEYYKKRGLAIGDLEPNYDTYHPHFHVVIAVNRSYFTQTSQYISKERWLELWQEAFRDKSISQVDVRKATVGNLKEVYELAKYSAKDNDYLVSKPVFDIFYKALKGKRLIVFSGLFKDASKMYDEGKLDVYKKQDNIEYIFKLYYGWHKENYYKNVYKKELTEEEKLKLNKKLDSDYDYWNE